MKKVLSVCLMVFCSGSFGDVVTVEFEAHAYDGHWLIAQTAFWPGDTITGSFVYDTTHLPYELNQNTSDCDSYYYGMITNASFDFNHYGQYDTDIISGGGQVRMNSISSDSTSIQNFIIILSPQPSAEPRPGSASSNSLINHIALDIEFDGNNSCDLKNFTSENIVFSALKLQMTYLGVGYLDLEIDNITVTVEPPCPNCIEYELQEIEQLVESSSAKIADFTADIVAIEEQLVLIRDKGHTESEVQAMEGKIEAVKNSAILSGYVVESVTTDIDSLKTQY